MSNDHPDPVPSLCCSPPLGSCHLSHRPASRLSSRTLHCPEIPSCSDVYPDQLPEVPSTLEYSGSNWSETVRANKMLVFLPEDEKAGFFFQGLFMNHLPADMWMEWITDPQWMATRADKLLTVCGRVNTVQSLSSQVFEDFSLVPHNP